MTEDRKYFIFNKPMDYRRGTGQGLDAAGRNPEADRNGTGVVFLQSSGQPGRENDLASTEDGMRGKKRWMGYDNLLQRQPLSRLGKWKCSG